MTHFPRHLFLALLLALLGLLPPEARAQELPPRGELRSPDGKLLLSIYQDGPPGVERLLYRVYYNGEEVIGESPLGIVTGAQRFVEGLRLLGIERRSVVEQYTMATGKRRARLFYQHEYTLSLANAAGAPLQLVVRAANDGFAYRYRLPGTGAAQILGEESSFRLPPGARLWAQAASPSYEGFYVPQAAEPEIRRGDISLPLLYTTGTRWVLLSEAALDDGYGASRVTALESNAGLLRVRLPDPALVGALPWETPWRLGIVGDGLAAIVESTLVDDLSAGGPERVPAWIKPGRVAWSWWADPASSRDEAAQRRYVDFAARLGWEYVLLDEGWSPTWAPRLIEYARSKGVGVILWARWTDLDERREQFWLPTWKSWGAAGIKVDFLKSDSQRRMEFYEQISALTYGHQLMLNFHGATLPRGQARRWPHIMTVEAVYGAEYYQLGEGPTPRHNATLPFTRNAVGSMDYTPATLSARGRTTSAAHEIALAILFESGWQHLADAPQSYERSPALPLLRQIPASWDDTRFLAGYPGEHAALARRSGRDWFLAAIDGGGGRELSLALDFLGPGNYQAEVYRDGGGDQIVVERRVLSRDEALSLRLAPGGGAAVRLVAPPITEVPVVPVVYLPLVTQ
jgi:alpha-glucosidase